MTAPIVKIPVVVIEETGRVLYALQPKQYQVFRLCPVAHPGVTSGPVHIGCGGAAGGGKSWLSDAILTAVALVWPGSSTIIFRGTEKEIKANHVNKMRAQIPEEVDGLELYRYNGEDMVMNWANGSRTYFGFLRHDDDVFTYQGNEYDCIIFEEATHYTEFQVTYLTGNRLRSTVPGSVPFAVYPSNPGNRGHQWFKRRFIARNYRDTERDSEHAFVQMFLKDNQELMQRDPGYARKLDQLPEPWRSWQRDGNWEAGAGAAFPDLSYQRHLVKPFEIPEYWGSFGAFDWGFNHPWSFGKYRVNEDGRMFCTQSASGHHMSDHDIAKAIKECIGSDPLVEIVAGHDCWSLEKAHQAVPAPTVADLFMEYGLYLVQADIARVNGYRQVRLRLQGSPGAEPNIVWFDTPQNRRALSNLETMVTSDRNPDDVLKVDADEYGEGGDDDYDQIRYACQHRPTTPLGDGTGPRGGLPFDMHSADTLAAERDRLYRRRPDMRALTTPAHRPPAFGEDYE